VVPYGPYLPSPAIFERKYLRNYLLTKLINGERAAMYAFDFKDKLERTRKTVLGEICKRYINSSKKSMRWGKYAGESMLRLPDSEDSLSPEKSRLDKFKGFFTKSGMTLSTFRDKVVILCTSLEEKTNLENSLFDGLEFLLSLQQLVALVKENTELVSMTAERKVILDSAITILMHGTLLIFCSDQRKNNKELPPGVNIGECKTNLRESLSYLSKEIDRAAKSIKEKKTCA